MLNLKINQKIYLFLFRFGIFLLVSAPAISAFCLLISLIHSCILNWRKIFKDKWNYLFIIASLLMIFIAFFQSLELNELSISIFEINNQEVKERLINWNSFSSLIGLSNWLPLFLCFWGFQPYLSTNNDREIVAKLFVTGSVPVLVSGFGQYWFNWYGQMDTMNGLIIWFQQDTGSGITSIFSNQNYAGSWLNIVFPFAIAMFCQRTRNIFKKGSSLLFVISIAFASYLTTSRNAWGGLLLTIPLLFGPSYFHLIIPILSLLAILIFLKIFNYIPENIDSFLNSIIPSKYNIFSQFSPSIYTDKSFNRNTIFLFAINMISKKPFIGLGAATFPIYYYMQYEIYMGHAHNLFLDYAFSFGIFVALIVFTNIFLLGYLCFKKIYFPKVKKNLENFFFERAWFTSFLVLLFSQMFDVQYFDLRISLSFWILLAGMKCIVSEVPKEQTQIS
tara:strand:- start:777 stop:2117 length:1341 start_codon:yes stop_codon:yes gene_type:complete